MRSRLNRLCRASRAATRSSTSSGGTFDDPADYRSGVLAGLQQTGHDHRLEVADRDRLVLVVYQRHELFGQAGAVLLEPAGGVLLLAEREQPIAVRALDPAHVEERGDVQLGGAASSRDTQLGDQPSRCAACLPFSPACCIAPRSPSPSSRLRIAGPRSSMVILPGRP